MKHQLPQLSYAYDALEPYIDELTMQIHHDKHHQAYVNKLNEALEKYPELQEKSVESLIKNLELIPKDIRTAVRNNGGGHYNHSLFWQIMKPVEGRLRETIKGLISSDKEPDKSLAIIEEIEVKFGSFENFQKQLYKISVKFFGSGWSWLILNKDGELEITTWPNHDGPIMFGSTPLLVLDLWEHAYYLRHQNRRPEYIEAWWHVVNWEEINKNFIAAKLPGSSSL